MLKTNVSIWLSMLIISYPNYIGLAKATESQSAESSSRIASTVKNTQVLKLPKFQSDVVASLNKDQQVNITLRQRAWYFISVGNEARQVEPTSTSGWVNMLSVRFLSTPKREGDLGIGALYQSVSKDSLPTVSTGVRGFDEQKLKQAKADFTQLTLLKQYQVSKEQALNFAKQGQIYKSTGQMGKE